VIFTGTWPLGPKPVKMRCPNCNMDIKTTTVTENQAGAHIACIVLCLLGWVMMQVLFPIDTVVLMWSITVCYWYVCERKVLKTRSGTVSAVQVSVLETHCPLLVGCSGVWYWLWHVRSFWLLMGNIAVRLTTWFLGSSTLLLHAGSTYFKSQPWHQQSWQSIFVVFISSSRKG
jgi:hypothetical protein